MNLEKCPFNRAAPVLPFCFRRPCRHRQRGGGRWSFCVFVFDCEFFVYAQSSNSLISWNISRYRVRYDNHIADYVSVLQHGNWLVYVLLRRVVLVRTAVERMQQRLEHGMWVLTRTYKTVNYRKKFVSMYYCEGHKILSWYSWQLVFRCYQRVYVNTKITGVVIYISLKYHARALL